MLTQDFCVFYKDHALYKYVSMPIGSSLLTKNSNFAGVVLASDEGKHITKTLGHRKAVLLGNHGLLTAGKTIEETVAYFVLLDKCCQVQLAADASSAGSGKPLVHIGEREAQNTWEALGTSASGYCKPVCLCAGNLFAN
jgi:ribulose-5-phosphate 4-epimerase/fuculose-1-phosphate aldolase